MAPDDPADPQVPAPDASRDRAVETLLRSSGALSTAATGRMDAELPWFADLSAQERSWVAAIVSSGVQAFVEWYREGEQRRSADLEVAASVFGAAPRDLAGTISLRQTVDLVRLSISVVETSIDDLLDPADLAHVRGAVLRYAREIAFATAEVYARAAEVRGAWDARLEALVVDSVLRAEADETVLSRASALGWADRGQVVVVLGSLPGSPTQTGLFDAVRRAARAAGMDALCAAQGDRLVVVLGGVEEPRAAALTVTDHFGDGPLVVGMVADDLAHAHHSARAAVAALRAADGWPEAPRPVLSGELLPERVLAGDGHARRFLVEAVHGPLVAARGELTSTLAAYFAQGGSVEGTARVLFCHPNTVRYRLRQVAELTGRSPTEARDALILQLALIVGRQSARPTRPV